MVKKELIKNTLTVVVTIVGIYLFFRYIVTLLLPFLIALGIAYLFNKPVSVLNRRTKLNPKIISALILITALALLSIITFAIVNRIVTEIGELLNTISENSDVYVAQFFGIVNGITEKLPFLKSIEGNISETVSEAVKSMITSLTAKLPSFIASIISALPSILIFSVIIILSSYYFCADFNEIKSRILHILPSGLRKRFLTFKKRLTLTGVRYLKACAIMLIITYFELLVGFLMLKIPYALTLSLVVAAVDMLPILGVGTVLLPWALWCYFTADTYTAVGLIIIFTTVTVVRRFIEPKVIGQGIGLSPITTLVAMYIGFKLLGLGGLFFSPLFAILILHALPDELSKKLGFDKENIATENKSKNIS